MTNEYTQAIKVLKDLGFNEVPSLEQIEKALIPKQKAYIKKHDGQLVITPPLTYVEILDKLKEVYSVPYWVYEPLWEQYDFGNDWRVDFVFPELKFTNQTWSEQQKSVDKEQKSCKGLQSIDARTYFMLNAIRTNNYKGLLDSTTGFTRLVQHDMKPVGGGGSYGPVVYSHGGGLYPGRSDERAFPSDGVRFLMGLNLNLSTFSTSSGDSLSSDLPDELTINGKIYRAVAKYIGASDDN